MVSHHRPERSSFEPCSGDTTGCPVPDSVRHQYRPPMSHGTGQYSCLGISESAAARLPRRSRSRRSIREAGKSCPVSSEIVPPKSTAWWGCRSPDHHGAMTSARRQYCVLPQRWQTPHEVDDVQLVRRYQTGLRLSVPFARRLSAEMSGRSKQEESVVATAFGVDAAPTRLGNKR